MLQPATDQNLDKNRKSSLYELRLAAQRRKWQLLAAQHKKLANKEQTTNAELNFSGKPSIENEKGKLEKFPEKGCASEEKVEKGSNFSYDKPNENSAQLPRASIELLEYFDKVENSHNLGYLNKMNSIGKPGEKIKREPPNQPLPIQTKETPDFKQLLKISTIEKSGKEKQENERRKENEMKIGQRYRSQEHFLISKHDIPSPPSGSVKTPSGRRIFDFVDRREIEAEKARQKRQRIAESQPLPFKIEAREQSPISANNFVQNFILGANPNQKITEQEFQRFASLQKSNLVNHVSILKKTNTDNAAIKNVKSVKFAQENRVYEFASTEKKTKKKCQACCIIF